MISINSKIICSWFKESQWIQILDSNSFNIFKLTYAFKLDGFLVLALKTLLRGCCRGWINEWMNTWMLMNKCVYCVLFTSIFFLCWSKLYNNYWNTIQVVNWTLLFISEPAPASLSLVIFHGFRRGSLHFGSILKFERQLHPRLYYFEDEFSLAKTLLILVVVLVLAVWQCSANL